MFRINNVSTEQINLFSKEDEWTEYQKKRIGKSWVGYFHDNIFPKINEKPYKVLYSDNEASCPNTPVNILISLMIIKSIANLTDEEAMDALLFDQRTQYAVHTLNSNKQPISKNMLGNFRSKIVKYEGETGINLFENTMRELNEEILNLSKVDRSIERIDSMMISASCKKLSRIELVYTVNHNFIKMLNDEEKVPIEFECYLNKNHKNEVIYRTRNIEASGKLSNLLLDSLKLYNDFKDDIEINKTKEFKLLERLIDEQYDNDNNKPKDGKEIKTASMQTPVDPDATYRYKYGNNVGYVANFVEATNNGNPLIVDWDVDKNITSDTKYINDYLDKKEENNEIEVEIVDGAYYSEDIKNKGMKKGIEIHPTELVGKKAKDDNLLEFKIDEETHQVLECPNGVKPIDSKYNQKKKRITAKFDKEQCEKCPFRDKCAVDKSPKKTNTLRTTVDKINTAKQREKNNDPEYRKISNMRAGIEGIPSILRRRNHIDQRPNQGEVYLKMDFGSSVISINIKRAIKIAASTAVTSSNLLKLFFKPLFFDKPPKILSVA